MTGAGAGMAGQGVGQLFGAAAGFLGANAVKDAAEQNANYLNQSADFDLARGRMSQMDVDRQAKAVLDTQATSYAAQGVDLSSESVLAVKEETFAEAARAKDIVELDAAMSAWGKREQARIGKDQAADQALGMRIGATGQLISGATSIATAGMM